jgi:hypothetical protein
MPETAVRKVGVDGSMRTIWKTRGGRSTSSSRCPINLRSGYYAAKLETTKNQYHISFFVRPKEGRPTADIAFPVRTFSYLAYGVTGPTEFSSTALSQYSGARGLGWRVLLLPTAADHASPSRGRTNNEVAR